MCYKKKINYFAVLDQSEGQVSEWSEGWGSKGESWKDLDLFTARNFPGLFGFVWGCLGYIEHANQIFFEHFLVCLGQTKQTQTNSKNSRKSFD